MPVDAQPPSKTARTFQVQRQALQQVRDALRPLERPSQVPEALPGLRQALETCGLSFDRCGLILVENEAPPQVNAYLGQGEGALGRLQPAGAARAVERWRDGESHTVPDVQSLPPEERRLLAPLYGEARALIEIPFSHGLLFLTAGGAGALDTAAAATAALLADVLSDGLLNLEYRRQRDATRTHYKQLVETPDLVFMLFDAQLDALYVSPRLQDWADIDPQDVYRDPSVVWKVVHPEELPAVKEALAAATAGQTPKPIECRWQPEGRPPLWVSLAAFPLYEDDSDLVSFEPLVQVVAHDITELKEAETVLRRGRRELEDQVRQRTRALSDAVEELQREISERRQAEEQKRLLEKQLRQAQKLQAVGELTAGIAHNFNNMLMVILGNVGVSRLEAPPALQAQLTDAENAARKAANMVRELMTFSRRQDAIERLPVNIEALANETMSMCDQTFDRQIGLSLDIESDLPLALGDAGQLGQVLLNLCLNSRDALKEVQGRTPRLRVLADAIEFDRAEDLPSPLASPGHYIRLRVADNGCGMSAETRERALEPFFTTKETDQGTGLGLATVYGIIEQHNGWIEIDSRLGQGTCMTVYLPTTEDAELAETEEDSAVLLEGDETILVIDDEEDIRKLLSRILRRYNYQVLVGVDGQDGLEIYKRERPRINLVLLDLMMPRKSGREVLDEMLSLDPGAKVVVSTGIADEDLRRVGAREVITKPYQEIEILRTLRRVLDEPA